MSGGVTQTIAPGALKVTITPVSNIQTCSLQRTDITRTGIETPVKYTAEKLVQGIGFTLESQNAYLLDLLLLKTGDPGSVRVRIEHNGALIWDRECTKFGDGFSGSWKYTIQ